jgi:aminoglycoside N3'-acetyltransferase
MDYTSEAESITTQRFTDSIKALPLKNAKKLSVHAYRMQVAFTTQQSTFLVPVQQAFWTVFTHVENCLNLVIV